MKQIITSTLGLGLLLGCASVARPPALESLSIRMADEQTRMLDANRPELVGEARAYLGESERYYEDGDGTKADLTARIAHARLDSATDLAAHDTAVASLAVLEASDKTLAEREAHLTKQREELARMRALNQQISALQTQLETIHASDHTAAANAKRAILAARAKQAEAIRAGASTRAADAYQQGRLLVESALESMRLELFREADETARRAIGAFETSMTMAEADISAESRRSDSIAKSAADSAKGQAALQSDATAAIRRAEDAEKDALSRGMPKNNAAMYASAVRILRVAETALDRRDFQRAIDKSDEATSRFNTEPSEPASIQMASSDASGPGLPATSATIVAAAVGTSARPQKNDLRDKVDERIVALRVARARSIGRSADERCPAAFREIDALLELAAQRNDAGDSTRAFELTVVAQETLDRCDGAAAPDARTTRGALTAPIAITRPMVERPPVVVEEGRDAAERSVEAAQMAIADAALELGDTPATKNARELLGRAESWLERSAFDRAARLSAQAIDQIARARTQKTMKSAADQQAIAKVRDGAEDSIQRAEEALARARVQSPDASLAEADALLTSAIRWLGAGDIARADAMAKKSKAAIDQAVAAKGKGKGTVTPAALTLDLSTTTSPTKATNDAQKTAEDRLASAQVRLARAQAERPTDPAVREADALVHSAADWLERGSPARAEAMATRASRALDVRAVQTASVSTDAAKTYPVSAVAAVAVVSTTDPDSKKRDTLRGRLIDATILMERSREEAKSPAAERRRDRGERFLEVANDALKKDDFLSADRFSLAAMAELEGSLVEAKTETKPAPDTMATSVPAAAAVPVTNVEPSAHTNGKRVVVQTRRASTQTITDPAVRTSYDAVMEALILRDRATARVSPERQDRVELGNGFMSRAREAWEQKSYVAADRLARAAVEEYQGALDADQKALTSIEASKRSESIEESKAASMAQAEARRTAQAEQKKAADARAVSLDAKRSAKTRDAEDAIRRAEVAAEVCERARCEKRDFAATVKAKSDLGAARVALGRGDFDRATALARDAENEFLAAHAEMPGEVTVPDDVGNVKIENKTLIVTPRVEFASGSTTIASDSEASVDGLAATIKANREAIARIRVVGHTDNRGARLNNVRISAARARSVVAALTARGIDAALFVAEGAGPDKPVASNDTKDGRESNRRVEFHYEVVR